MEYFQSLAKFYASAIRGKSLYICIITNIVQNKIVLFVFINNRIIQSAFHKFPKGLLLLYFLSYIDLPNNS